MNTTFTRCLFGLLFMVTFMVSYASDIDDSDVLVGLYCPDDAWATCQDELWDLSNFGNATYTNYDGTYDAGAATVEYQLNSCNVGYITRTWAVYLYGNHYTCSQTIHVASTGSFGYSNIIWPTEHVELEGCDVSTHPDDLPYDAQRPFYQYAECSMIATSYTDMIFNFGSSCEKVHRTWKVLDWCQYNPNGGNNSGLYTFVQIIKVNKGNAPTTQCTEAYNINSYDCNNGRLDVADLDLGSNACGGSYDITHNSVYADTTGANISGVYPVGTTTVQYTITYGCGSKAYCYTDVVVENNSQPHAYCIGEIVITLMGVDTDDDGVNDEGMVDIWAKDFDYGSTPSCGNGPLTFSFAQDSLVMSQTFTCEQVGLNILQIYITDTQGNQSICETTLDVQNNGANIQDCEPADTVDPDGPEDPYTPMARLSGEIMDIFGNTRADIMTHNSMLELDTTIVETIDTTLIVLADSIQSASGNWLYYEYEDSIFTTTIDTITDYAVNNMDDMTDGDGVFMFDEVEMHNDYTISLEIEKDYARSEVNYDDVWLLLYEILGYDQINDPLKIAAADVNRDGEVTREDLIILIDYVKGEIDDLPFGEWIIVDREHISNEGLESMVQDQNYKSTIHLDDLSENHMDLDFVVVQIGNITNINNTKLKSKEMNTMLDQIQDSPSLTMMSPLQVVSRNNINVENVQVYPNPFRDQFQISILNELSQFVDVKLMDVSGKAWISKRMFLEQGYQIIQMDADVNIPAGIYLYQVQLGAQVIQGKLVKS